MFSANHQPSGNLFSNNSSQRQPSTGNLFTNPSHQSGSSLFPERPKSSLFQIPNPFLQKSAPPASKEVPIHGTVDYIGRSHIHKRPFDIPFVCITGTIKDCSLDELRIQDHYNMKRNLLPPAKKQLVDTTLYKNSSKRYQNEFPTVFDPSRDLKNPFLSCSFSQTAQPMKNLFADLKASFVDIAEPPKTLGNPFMSQPRAFTIANNFGVKPAEQNQAPGSQQAYSKENFAKKQDPSSQPATSGKPKQEVIQAISNAGSFSYEVNKMVLVSSFISLLRSHKVAVPENLLDNTDFVPQLFKFLEEYNMNLPKTNIPQFPLNTLSSLSTKSKTQSKRKRRNRKKASQRSSAKKSQEEKIIQKNIPLKEVSNLRNPVLAVEQALEVGKKEAPQKTDFVQVIDKKRSLSEDKSLLKFVKKEDEEKIEIPEEAGELQKDQLKDEENAAKSFENGSSVVSVHSSQVNSSDADSVVD